MDNVKSFNIPEPFQSVIEKQQKEIEELESRILKVHQKATEQVEKLEQEKDKAITMIGEKELQIIELKERIERLLGWNDELQEELIEKDEKIERYEKALKFYADEENYEEWKGMSELTDYIHNVDFDGGDIAREELDKAEITFEEFVEYGKNNGGNIVKGMPWSFNYKGYQVTHENDECYLILMLDGFQKFTPKDVLIMDSNGEITLKRENENG